MSSDWAKKCLGDYCEKIGSGATPKGGKDAYLSSGPVYLIRSQNVHKDRFSPAGLAYISDEQAQKLGNVKVESGDILLNITGDSVARDCQALKRFLPARVNQHVAIIRPMASVFDARYLRYFFASPAQQNFMLGLAAVGATRNALTKGMIESFEVPCPPLALQQGIADVLTSLDDRITLLREINATLEAIAQALFKSWFVDFDPVHAKMQGRIPEGMDQATAALFPNSLEESELGAVPKGWKWVQLHVAYDINPTRKLKKGETAPYLDMAGVQTQGHSVSGVVQREVGSGEKFMNGDTLLARITPCLENGKTAFVDFLSDHKTGWGSTEFVVLRPKDPLPPYQAYLLARHPAFREHAIRSMSGTSGRQRIQNDVLRQFFVAVPNEPVAKAFSELVMAMHEAICEGRQKSQTLSALRDNLLPRLISGHLKPTSG